jgi:hypothetical protein
VLANVKREHIILLEKNQVYVPDNTTYGRDITAILHEVMKVEIRPQQVIDLKDRFYKSLSDEQYEQAKKLLKELEDVLGNNDADVLQAKVSLDLELL